MKLNKTKKINHSFLILLALTGGFKAAANPTIYPQYPDDLKGIQHPKDTEILADNKFRDRFYVLPPSNAYAYVTSYHSPSASNIMCESLEKLGQASTRYSQMQLDLGARLDEFDKKSEVAHEAYRQAQLAADGYKASSNAVQQIGEYDQKISTDQLRLTDLQKQLGTCGANCKPVYDEMNVLNRDVATLQRDRNNLIARNGRDFQAWERMQAAANTQKQYWQDSLLESQKMAERIAALQKTVSDIFQTYGTTEGGFANVEYDSKWEEKLLEIQTKNPNKSVSKITTANVNMYAAFVPKQSVAYLNSVPQILDYSVLGRSATDAVHFESYPSKVQADLRLSLAGSCPLMTPNKFPTSQMNGKLIFGLTTEYQYNAAFTSKASFTYNEKTFYQKVMKAGSSGWLFWKKSWESIDITNIDHTAFSFNWELSDPNGQLNFIERRKIEIMALNYAMTKMIDKYSTGYHLEEASVNHPKVPTSGLGEVGKGLFDLCGTSNSYCAAASFIMMGLDSIIAGGQSSGSGTIINDLNTTITWDDTTMTPVSGITAFMGDENKDPVPAPVPAATPSPTPQAGGSYVAN